MLTTTRTLQEKDTSIWVFPEGTRNLGQTLLPFKKGAFQMAITAAVPIVPVCVSTYSQHLKLNRWHSADIQIRSLPAIPTAGMTLDDMPRLMEMCREQMRDCIEAMDREVMAQQGRHAPVQSDSKRKGTASHPNL